MECILEKICSQIGSENDGEEKGEIVRRLDEILQEVCPLFTEKTSDIRFGVILNEYVKDAQFYEYDHQKMFAKLIIQAIAEYTMHEMLCEAKAPPAAAAAKPKSRELSEETETETDSEEDSEYEEDSDELSDSSESTETETETESEKESKSKSKK